MRSWTAGATALVAVVAMVAIPAAGTAAQRAPTAAPAMVAATARTAAPTAAAATAPTAAATTVAATNRYPATAVGIALAPGGGGWWIADADGSVGAGGTAVGYGSAATVALSHPIVGIAATPSGHGYWLVGSDGGVFAFGDAGFFGSTGALHLNKPIVGIAATPSGLGYWLVASDGGIFSFGDAGFFGSTGSLRLNKPIVAMVPAGGATGYWLVASDGGIFAYGSARFFGSTGSIQLNQPIVGGAATADSGGYWLVASDGGIFSFGDAPFAGSAVGTSLAGPVVGMVASGTGYALAAANGAVTAFGALASAIGVASGSLLPGVGTTSTGPGPTAGTGTTPGTPGAADPSGVPMPTGNVPGWTTVFSDDFTGTSLNENNWGAYEGQPGGDPGGWWDPSHVVVSGGMLQLQCYVDPAHANPANLNGYVCGGVGSGGALVQTYGQYDVRFRVDKGHGIGYAALLWPSYTSWPPEIDFAEDGGGDRSGTTATWHCGSNGDDSCQQQANLTIDLSQWHTLGVQWTPTSLVYTVDGVTWATMTGPGIPDVAMEMDLQMQAGACGDPYTPCPDASTPSNVNMDVDWVVAYKPAP